MKSIEDVEKFFTNAAVSTNAKMDAAVLDKVLISHEKTTHTKSAAIEPDVRRTIMKSPIAKLAVAAAVIAAVALGLREFIGSGSTSGQRSRQAPTAAVTLRGASGRWYASAHFPSTTVSSTLASFDSSASRHAGAHSVRGGRSPDFPVPG